MRIPSGKTDQVIYFVARDAADTLKTGLSSFAVYRSRNGGAAVAYTTPTITEIDATNMPGLYGLLIDEDTTIASGSDSEEYAVRITQASMVPVTRTIELYRRDTTSGATSTAQTGDNFARLGAPAGASISADIAATKGDTAAIKAKTDNLPSDPADHSVVIAATDAILSAVGDVPTNAELTTALGTADDAVLAALAAHDAKFTFSVAGKVDANMTHINGTELTGDGSSGNKFGPA